MVRLTQKEYAAIHRDYRGIWSDPSQPDLIGRKSVMSGCIGPKIGFLAIEGVDFEIIKAPRASNR